MRRRRVPNAKNGVWDYATVGSATLRDKAGAAIGRERQLMAVIDGAEMERQDMV